MDSQSNSYSSRRPSAVIDDEGWQRRRSAMYRRESNFSEYVRLYDMEGAVVRG